MTDKSTYIQHAEVKLFQAGLTDGADREQLVAEAKDALIRAERLAPGCAAWKLACISAESGEFVLCRKWLERAHASNTLPPRAEIERQKHMARLRKMKWFAGILKKAP